MKKILGAILTVLTGLTGILAARAMKLSRPKELRKAIDLPPIDPHPVAEHLSGLIQCQTISLEVGKQVEETRFLEMHEKLKKYFPGIHTHLKKETINQLSLLYTWEGSLPELPGLLLAAHQDVVPPGNEGDWHHPPFDGEISDGFVWGRGTLDIKNQLVTVMEAVEHLLSQGYQPKRTIYLAFGHDEEIGGIQGAFRIAETLQQRGVRLGAVIDEGGTIMEGAFPGVEGPVALIGTGEKGYLTLQLKAESQPGHSSTPSRETTIGILARAITRLEEHPFPADVSLMLPVLQAVGERLSPQMRVMVANDWLFKPALLKVLDSNPRTSAAIRTTIAPTMISGGTKENILPGEAFATVNFRLVPADSPEKVVEMVKERIQDKRVKVIRPELSGWDATPQSDPGSPFFQSLEALICQVFDNPPVAPYLVLGGTDARYYARICPNVYRFTPLRVNPEDQKGVHGLNEHIRVDDLAKMVQFFVQLIQRWDDPFRSLDE